MSVDWYLNETWDEDVAAHFEEKLRRARRKEQYLRIQACCLTSTHPDVALELLERYFELPDHFDHAQAFVDRAAALKTLGRLDEAVEAYEAALAREVEFPNLLTQAYLELPFLIATTPMPDLYLRALGLLEQNPDRLMFPLDRFLWNASRALILESTGDLDGAIESAIAALDAAGREKSGFRYHPGPGLVRSEHDQLVARLEELSGE